MVVSGIVLWVDLLGGQFGRVVDDPRSADVQLGLSVGIEPPRGDVGSDS